MTMLFTAVDQLDQPELLVPTLCDLGQRHMAYGVEHDDYTPAERTASAATYEWIAAMMHPVGAR